MLTAHSEEDLILLDEGNLTLSQQLEYLGNTANKSCSQVMYLYKTLEFNKLIKPNPFEYNWKDLVILEEASGEFDPGQGCENKKENESSDIKTHEAETNDQMSTSNLCNIGEILVNRASKENAREIEEKRNEVLNQEGENEQRDTVKEKEEDFPRVITEEKEDKKTKVKAVIIDPSEKSMKTFPNGILKMGDKSRYTRGEEKSIRRGNSNSSSRSPESSGLGKTTNNLSVFSRLTKF